MGLSGRARADAHSRRPPGVAVSAARLALIRACLRSAPPVSGLCDRLPLASKPWITAEETRDDEAVALRPVGPGTSRTAGRRGPHPRPFRQDRRHRRRTSCRPPSCRSWRRSIRRAARGRGQPAPRRAGGEGRQVHRHRPQLLRPCGRIEPADPAGAGRLHQGDQLHRRPQRRRDASRAARRRPIGRSSLAS